MRRLALVLIASLTLASCADVNHVNAPTGAQNTAPASNESVRVSVTDAQLAKLPEATTSNAVDGGQIDQGGDATDGLVVRVSTKVAVFNAPNDTPFASVPPQQIGNPTWLPVIDSQPGWYRVLLPSRPNGVSGWVIASQVSAAKSAYLIRVHLTPRTIELFNGGTRVGSWRAAIGAASTPTPVGRTFLLASIHDPNQTYSPVILPLGTHSATLDSYGGGPGTVAIHTWLTNGKDTPSIYGQAVSHGCVRVPLGALNAMKAVPLGTVVLISTN